MFDDNNDDFEQVENPEQEYDDLSDDNEPDESEDDSDETPATEDDALGFSFDEPEEGEHGDPFAGKPAPDWVKKVREENRELRRQLKQVQQPQQTALRDKPTLAAYDYDETAYEADLQHWYAEKAQHDEVVRKEQEKHQKIDDDYRLSVNNIRRIAKDYDEVEQQVIDTLPGEQQALLKMGASDPAKLVYALGKSPNKLAELSQLDAINFVKQIALMEYQMSNKSRNPNKPQPKTHELKGNAGGTDTKLAKLEEEAAKTGDRSKVMAYKKSLKNK